MQLLIFILFLGIVQAILLGIFFLHKRLHRQGYFFLLLYLSVIILQLSLKLISKAWLFQNLNIVYSLSYQLPFLYGPLIYLFVRSAYNKNKFRLIELFHFIPFLVAIFHFAVAGPNEYPSPVIDPFFKPFTRLMMQLACIGIYHYLALKEWRKYRASVQQQYGISFSPQLKWVSQFVFSSLFVTTLVSLTIYYMYMFFPALQPMRFGFAALTLFIYWVSYSALSQPQLFLVVKGAGTEINSPDRLTRLTIHRTARKYANSALGTEESNRIVNTLEDLIIRKKIYLDPDLTIEKMAHSMGCSKHHLSQVLNERIKQSFSDYLNFFRVEEAKQLLADQERKLHKIASIAFDAGFNSISTFNEVFKKFAGCTPSEYRKHPLQHSRKERV